MDKKKIVVYINTMNASGGIERVVANLLNEWSKLYNITLLVKDNKDSFYEISELVEIRTLDEPLSLNMHSRISRIIAVAFNTIKVIKKLRDFIKETEVDYLYTVTPLNSLEFYLASHKIVKKMVISEHASAFAVNKIYQIIKRFLYPKAYCISVPNKMDCKVYKEWGCNTIYIPHLVTFNNNYRNCLDSKVILNVGRLTSDKRQKELLWIWKGVNNKNGWKLRIVGSGEEKDALEMLIRNLELNDSVEMIEHTKNIKKIYQEASLFAFTSRMEGFGMVLLEAMSFGIPCISYDCPSGPRDIIINGKNGYLIKNGDKSEFSRRLERLINDEEDLLEMGKEAFILANNWNNEAIINMWMNVYK